MSYRAPSGRCEPQHPCWTGSSFVEPFLPLMAGRDGRGIYLAHSAAVTLAGGYRRGHTLLIAWPSRPLQFCLPKHSESRGCGSTNKQQQGRRGILARLGVRVGVVVGDGGSRAAAPTGLSACLRVWLVVSSSAARNSCCACLSTDGRCGCRLPRFPRGRVMLVVPVTVVASTHRSSSCHSAFDRVKPSRSSCCGRRGSCNKLPSAEEQALPLHLVCRTPSRPLRWSCSWPGLAIRCRASAAAAVATLAA